MRNGRLVRAALLCLLPAAPLAAQDSAEVDGDVTQGALRVKTKAGRWVECPLRHTEVQAEVSGFVARVKVTQAFANPSDEPIEAVYVFPLPHRAAVDDMSMVVGNRRIVGVVRRRAEAREIYRRAVAAGLTASLLEQERPNIFTQSVGNIPAGQEVHIEISYVDVLAYEGGTYEFHFPMVVGPRYIPSRGAPSDASRINPPVLKPGYRNGHDVSLSLRLEAGVPIRDLRVTSHESEVQRAGRSQARVKLSPADSIPNKDFVLRYAVAGSKPEVALLTHAPRDEDGYFVLMVQPRQMEDELREAPPREICFLVDVSGSMSGEPTAEVVQTMRLLLQRMRPQDTIQVVTFASDAQRLFPAYLPATPENVSHALSFTSALQGSGGTEMLRGIRTVLTDPVEEGRVRIVLMLTDGYIGNEDEIIRDVARRAGDQIRFWAVGIGSSPNRHLIDGVGRQGGMSATLGLREDPAPLVARVVDRMQRAQLGRIELDWGRHEVYETYPARIPDLWSGSPVVVVGRYRTEGTGTLRVNGLAEGQPVSFPLEVEFPTASGEHAVLAKVWARRKIEDLSEQRVVAGDPLEEEITELALQYRLASAFTSFVAVDESEQARLLASPRPPRRVVVPVPLPEGVRYEGIFGGQRRDEDVEVQKIARQTGRAYRRRGSGEAISVGGAIPLEAAPLGMGVDGGVVGGVAGGMPGGFAGGVPGGVVVGAPASYIAAAATPAPPSAGSPQLSKPAHGPAAPPPPPPPPTTTTYAARRAPVAYVPPDTTRHDEAKKELARARDLAARKDWLGARRSLQRAWLFEESYFGASPWSDDGTRGALAAEWQSLESAQAAAMSASHPVLARPLDLAVRNEELEAALASVARAAGLTWRLVPGSLADAAALQKRESLRVAYLDLRRATPAQAFGWLLGPFGLEWTFEDGAVVVRSARRGPGVSVWVYEVADLVQRDGAGVQAAAQRLFAMVGGTRLDPVRLLVEGDAAAHSHAARVLTALRTPGEKVPAGLEPLQAKGTAPSASAAATPSEALGRADEALRTFSWDLLAAALAGEGDDEAVSELREAWRVPGLAEAIAQHPAALTVAARTTWAIALARKAKADDPALKALADEAHAVMGDVLQQPDAAPAPPEADLYLALLQREASLPAGLRRRLPTVAHVLGRTSAGFRPVAASLLKAPEAGAIHAALEEGRLQGDDAAVLAAWALREAGPAAWSQFRGNKATWLSRARASGGAVRVVNRLEASPRAVSASAPVARTAPGADPPRLALALAGVGSGLATVGLLRRRKRRDARAG